MIWLHIGTKKTGSTALQHFLTSKPPRFFRRIDLTYVCPKRKSSCNGLVWAINNGREKERQEISDHLTAQLEMRETKHALISSEMFYGLSPQKLFEAVPPLRSEQVRVLVYLRRQDLYLEAMYLQRLKNGRFFGSLDDYIKHFHGSNSDYHAELRPWEDLPNITLVPKIYEPAGLHRGNVVSDVFNLIGLPEPDLSNSTVSVSPSKSRAMLLSLLAETTGANVRHVQRILTRDYPESNVERAVFFTPEERNIFFDGFAEGNEMLRQRYFPDRETLFDINGLGTAAPQPNGIGFSEEQMAELRDFFRALEKTAFK